MSISELAVFGLLTNLQKCDTITSLKIVLIKIIKQKVLNSITSKYIPFVSKSENKLASEQFQ